MSKAREFAKYFARNGLQNSFDGNMTLQKYLLFANLIHVSLNDAPLFNDEILAFEHGCVVESVRQEFRQHYTAFIFESSHCEFSFTPEEQKTLDYVEKIFGESSAKELSELNHAFDFWKKAYNASIDDAGFKHKKNAVVTLDDMREEAYKIKKVLDGYEVVSSQNLSKETINDITFYYDPTEFAIDEISNKLYRLSLNGLTERSYTVSKFGGEMVIF